MIPFVVLTGEVAAYSLYLKAQAVSKQSVVRIGDIARVAGELNPGTIGAKVVVKDLRRPRYISRADLERSLAVGPEKLERVYGNGVWIVPVTRRMSAEALVDELRRRLAGLAGGKDFLKRHRLRVDGGAGLDATPDADALHFVLPSRIEQFSPGMRMITVDVRGKRDGREKVLLRQHVPVKIFRKVRVSVATRDLAVGERMRKGDWRVEEREIDYAPERYAMGDLTGRRVMSKLRQGTALTASVVQVMPAVRRGQPVELVYQTPGLVIKCRSVAGRDGKVGDIIPVTTVFPSGKGKRELRARIVDDGRAVLVGPLASGKAGGLASRE